VIITTQNETKPQSLPYCFLPIISQFRFKHGSHGSTSRVISWTSNNLLTSRTLHAGELSCLIVDAAVTS